MSAIPTVASAESNVSVWKLALETSTLGSIITDESGVILFINSAARDLLGIGDSPVSRTVKDILPASIELLQPQLTHGLCRSIWTEQSTILRITSTPLWENGTHLGFVIDLQNEDTSRAQLEAIFNSSTDGFWLADAQGTVLNINAAAAVNSGFEQQDVLGKTVHELLSKKYINRSAIAKTLRTNEQSSVLEHKTFTGKTLLITASPVFDETGELVFVVANERDITQLNTIRDDLERSKQELERAKEELSSLKLKEITSEELIAESEAMQGVLNVSYRLALSGASNILITGESGTGKGVLAKFIHGKSSREKKPFIHINCAALPHELLEAELFGYEKGAFTSANAQGKAGLIELAHKGTLFLDEIGDMPLTLQAKILKYLDDHEVMRLGGTTPLKVDCTIITATNQNLLALVEKKKFRSDLFYRLSGFLVKLPPLRTRSDDIISIAQHYLSIYNSKYHQKESLSQTMRRALMTYDFPGNVRELKNIIKRLILIGETEVLKELRPDKKKQHQSHASGTVTDMATAIAEAEKSALAFACARCKTTREIAAMLKISQSKVVRDLRKYGLAKS